jgi:hypothetical protein
MTLFLGGAGPLLLVLDRADDAVTPLLSAYGADFFLL